MTRGTLRWRKVALYAAAAGEPCTLGLRAEDLLTERGPSTLPVNGTVVVREALGAENLIAIETDGITLHARVGRNVLPALGDRITLHADLAQMHLFNAASGVAWPREA